MQMAKIGYAGAAAKPRPVPPETLYDLARRFNSVLLTGIATGTIPSNREAQSLSNSLFFAFSPKPFKPDREESIPANKQDLWCLLRPGDYVILSDGVTHHVTTVDRVSRDKDEVVFLDAWPERFFLLKGRNVKGVRAHPLPEGNYTLLTITREELLRVIAGLVTLDDPGLIEHYFSKINPRARFDPSVRVAFGLALLDFGDDRFANEAAPHLEEAAKLAEKARDPKQRARALRGAVLALRLDFYDQRARGGATRAEGITQKLKELVGRGQGEELEPGSTADDYYRLGSAAGRAGDLDAAIRHYGTAIEANPRLEGAYLYRGIAKSKRGDYPGVIVDMTEALKLNRQNEATLQKEIEKQPERGPVQKEDDERAKRSLTFLRVQALENRGRAYLLTKKMMEARSDAHELLQFAPERPEGFALQALCEVAAGHIEYARAYAQEAVHRARGTRLQRAYEAIFRSLLEGDVLPESEPR
jgi:tetratricopeptide (TPR) repeat protein